MQGQHIGGRDAGHWDKRLGCGHWGGAPGTGVRGIGGWGAGPWDKGQSTEAAWGGAPGARGRGAGAQVSPEGRAWGAAQAVSGFGEGGRGGGLVAGSVGWECAASGGREVGGVHAEVPRERGERREERRRARTSRPLTGSHGTRPEPVRLCARACGRSLLATHRRSAAWALLQVPPQPLFLQRPGTSGRRHHGRVQAGWAGLLGGPREDPPKPSNFGPGWSVGQRAWRVTPIPEDLR